MKRILFIFICILIASCKPTVKGDATRFKSGTFEVPGKEGIVSKTTVIRNDSLQIEKYTKYREVSTDSGVFMKSEKRIDTFFIEWKNNFYYTLKMKSPKNDLDKEPAFFQITKVKENSYDFTLKIGYSEYTHKGTVYKVN